MTMLQPVDKTPQQDISWQCDRIQLSLSLFASAIDETQQTESDL